MAAQDAPAGALVSPVFLNGNAVVTCESCRATPAIRKRRQSARGVAGGGSHPEPSSSQKRADERERSSPRSGPDGASSGSCSLYAVRDPGALALFRRSNGCRHERRDVSLDCLWEAAVRSPHGQSRHIVARTVCGVQYEVPSERSSGEPDGPRAGFFFLKGRRRHGISGHPRSGP